MQLVVDGKRFRLEDRPDGFDSYSFRVGSTTVPLSETVAAAELALEPGETKATWLAFAGIDAGPFIPAMTLELPLPGRVVSLNLNRHEAARLNLKVRRAGPRDALAIIEVGGHLNTVNVAAFVEQFDSLHEQGVARAVLVWSELAVPPDEFVLRWLQQGRQPNPYNRQFNQLPPFPQAVDELHVAGLENLTEIVGVGVHATLESAVSAALASAFSAARPRDILAALRGNDPNAQVAALEHGAVRLPADTLPSLMALQNAESPEVRRAVLAALQYFAGETAREALVAAVRGSEPALAEEAIRSLARSRYPESTAALAKLLEQNVPLEPARLMSILTTAPSGMARCHTEIQPARRPGSSLGILEALKQLGHPLLKERLLESLQSDNEACETWRSRC
ncbi:MAG: HEAT repeat domain-containing protein [Planctomycetaceae bacterium]